MCAVEQKIRNIMNSGSQDNLSAIANELDSAIDFVSKEQKGLSWYANHTQNGEIPSKNLDDMIEFASKHIPRCDFWNEERQSTRQLLKKMSKHEISFVDGTEKLKAMQGTLENARALISV